MRPLCLYHAHCADGLAAAWAVQSALPDAECVHVRYGEAPPRVYDRHVIIVDFSYPRDTLRLLAESACSILILDHHKTAQEELLGIMPPSGSWQDWFTYVTGTPLPAMSRVRALFDMDRSGAGLAWDYFNPGEPRPWAISRVEDRDLWRFELNGSRELNAVIGSYPDHDLQCFEHIVHTCAISTERDKLLDEGEAIIRRQSIEISNLLKLARRAVIGGQDIPVLNCPARLGSEVGNRLSVGEPFSATYFDSDTHRNFSLRSQPGGTDVSAVARKLGGDGHERAAGFRVPLAGGLGL